ncbi:hypothetical protein [Pseudochryseolinea flava]|uniref:Uncharacterized protein n=1 Tax=Pseudochryseolinea flava TaxID=2059302 RepID=A0A364Y0Z4_9BACT|nr:hypothetical protein [Pseudochryseolinea flava]RAW00345.1 hypothetical protein DQQ10_14930 [Pseudochryseolinea flava]
MKTSLIVLATSALLLSSFTTSRNRDTKFAAEKTALQVIDAFKHESAAAYVALFPNLVDFHTIMGLNSTWYGSNLDAAKKDFADHFDELDRATFESFQDVIMNGKVAGIDWKSIKFVQASLDAEPTKSIDAAKLTIVFTAGERSYSLCIDRAMWIRGEFKVSQFIELK